ncbi:putative protein RhsE, partial [Escherichia coli 88.0221]
RGV